MLGVPDGTEVTVQPLDEDWLGYYSVSSRDDAATQAAYYDQARRWLRNNQNGYVSGEEEILSYYFQPVEIDARAYAAEETERLQGLIDKELQKET